MPIFITSSKDSKQHRKKKKILFILSLFYSLMLFQYCMYVSVYDRIWTPITDNIINLAVISKAPMRQYGDDILDELFHSTMMLMRASRQSPTWIENFIFTFNGMILFFLVFLLLKKRKVAFWYIIIITLPYSTWVLQIIIKIFVCVLQIYGSV